MGEWSRRPLGEVVTLQRGHDLPTGSRRFGSVPVIGSFGITGYHDVAKYRGPGVAIGRSGASIGVATWCSDDYWPLNTCLFVSDFHGNDQRWVYYLLHSIEFERFNSGSAQPSLNRNYLVNIPIDLPPLPQQRAIAEVLGALDDKIEANRNVGERCDELFQTLWVRASNGAVPRIPVREVARLERGLSYHGEGLGSGEPMVNLANFSSDGRFHRSGIKYYSGPSKEKHWVHRNDLIVANTDLTQRREVLGQPALVPLEGALFSHHLYALRPLPEAPKWILLWLYGALRQRDFRDRVVTFATGTTVAALPTDALLAYEFPYLADGVGQRWAEDATLLLGLAERAEMESVALAELRDALLPKLLSGELRVRDAESLVGEAV